MAQPFAPDDIIRVKECNDRNAPDPRLQKGVRKSLGFGSIDKHARAVEEAVGGSVRQRAMEGQIAYTCSACPDLLVQAVGPRLSAADQARGAGREGVRQLE